MFNFCIQDCEEPIKKRDTQLLVKDVNSCVEVAVFLLKVQCKNYVIYWPTGLFGMTKNRILDHRLPPSPLLFYAIRSLGQTYEEIKLEINLKSWSKDKTRARAFATQPQTGKDHTVYLILFFIELRIDKVKWRRKSMGACKIMPHIQTYIIYGWCHRDYKKDLRRPRAHSHLCIKKRDTEIFINFSKHWAVQIK